MNGTLAVTVQPTILLLLTQLFHEPMQPNHLFTSLCSSNILWFWCWKYNNLFQFWNPTYFRYTYSKKIPCCSPPVFLSPTISTSTYPYRIVFEPPKHNAWEVVPLKYLRIHYTSLQFSLPGLFIYLVTIPTPCAISSLVHTMAYIKLPTVDE